MGIFLLIINLLSIKLCYDISKENNYNVTLWTILAILFGYIPLIILLIIILTKKKTLKKRKEITLLIVFVTISISISAFIYYKPTHIEKTYYGNLLNKGKIINKNVTITINGTLYKEPTGHKQIDGTMELCNKKYMLNVLVSKDDYYKIFPIDKENFLETNELHLSKNFDCVTIKFNNSDKDYSGYTISATNNKQLDK